MVLFTFILAYVRFQVVLMPPLLHKLLRNTLPTKALTLLSSLLLLALTSCAQPASQCKQLITLINDAQSFAEAYEQSISTSLAQVSGAQDLPQLKAAAAAYMGTVQDASVGSRNLAESMGALELTDAQLSDYRDRYVAVATQWSNALVSAREAMQLLAESDSEAAFQREFDRFQAKTNSAYSLLQSLDSEEAQLVEGINSYCQPDAS